MPAQNDIHSDGGCTQMKPGDRVVWLYSRKRSFVAGRGVQRVPGVIVRICRRRIRLRVRLLGAEKLVNVSPDNVICEEDG